MIERVRKCKRERERETGTLCIYIELAVKKLGQIPDVKRQNLTVYAMNFELALMCLVMEKISVK